MEPEEFTRRLWLVTMGTGAAFGGLDLNAGVEPQLPPGLYQPSADHLAHVLKPVASTAAPSAPLFFTIAEYRQLAGLISQMLGEDPETAPVPEIAAWIDLIVYDGNAVRAAARALSPAHRALAVAYYGEEAVRELETFDAPALCRAGLESCRGKPPLTIESSGDPFIEWLRRRVIEGFYTSAVGLKELDYKGNSFYASPPGCGP
jgi:hypothetical protein